MLRAVAIDDEPMALEVIKQFSSKIPFIELTATFTRSSTAIEYLQKEDTDLLFLDIKMPDMSGIDLLKSLTSPPLVIFTTAYSKHAVESFELNAVDYLLKPFSQTRFSKACQKASELSELRKTFQASLMGPPSVFIKNGYEQVRVLLENIIYVQASGNYVEFILTEGKILSRLTLNQVEDLLPGPAFIRIHRSCIVAIKHITKVEKNTVWIKKLALPVSAGFAAAIEKIQKRKSVN